MTKNTGDFAFPSGSGVVPYNPGMELRDYFAAKCMQGDVAAGVHDDDFLDIAHRAYAMADAMLKAREK